MKLGIFGMGEGRAGLQQLVEQAQAAEAAGFHSMWLGNIFGLDAMTACAVLGGATETLQLGTGVMPTYPRHPYAMAQQAMTTQIATGGRFHLGVGLSHRVVIENMLGMSWDRSYSHMCEYLDVLVPLIRTGRVNHEGKLYKCQAMLSAKDVEPCPILVAALAPKMLALAGRVADGTVTWMTGLQTLKEHVAPRIREAAAEAGRDAPRVVVALPVAVTDDEAAAREAAGKAFAMYGQLPSYRAMLDREGAAGPADVAIVGSSEGVQEQIAAFEEAGATEFVASPFPVGDDRAASLRATRDALKQYLARA